MASGIGRARGVLASVAIATFVAGCAGSSTPSSNGASADTGPAAPIEGTRVGDLAPDFTLRDGDGRPVHLTDYRGRVVLFELSAMW